MKTITSLSVKITLIISILIGALPAIKAAGYAENELYVQVKKGTPLPTTPANGVLQPREVDILKEIAGQYTLSEVKMPFAACSSSDLQHTLHIRVDDSTELLPLMNHLNNDSRVSYAERIPVYMPAAAPNDLYYNKQVDGSYFSYDLGSTNTSWHLNQIQAPEAWEVSTSNSNIIVAILDNAVWIDHPDLQNKVISAIDLADGDNDPNPPINNYQWSHGTMMAGIIGAESNNSIGIASVSNGVSLMAVKLATDMSDGAPIQNVAEGIIWAADNGADIINLPFYTTQWSQTLLNAVSYAQNKGVVIVAPAGNDNNGTQKYYPAAFDNVIAVASCDADDTRSAFSNYGEWVDVMAPGGFSTPGLTHLNGLGAFGLLSTSCNTPGSIDDILPGTSGGAASYFAGNNPISGNYDIVYGTSAATAVTSGVCALMLSANPDLTPVKIKEILRSTANNVDEQNPGYAGMLGTGRINAAAAVQTAVDMQANLIADFQASTCYININESVNFTDMSIGIPTAWSWEFPGATPAASAEQNPTGITYTARGIYPVTLTVTKGDESATETKTSLITVGAFPVPPAEMLQSAWIELNTESYYGYFMQQISIIDETTAWTLATDDNTDYTILKTSDAGKGWTINNINPQNIVAFYAVNNETAAALSQTGNDTYGISTTDDGGVTWSQETSITGTSATLTKLGGEKGICAYINQSSEIEIITTEDLWVNTTTINLSSSMLTDEKITSPIVTINENSACFGTSAGRIFVTSDDGQNWNQLNLSLREPMIVKKIAITNGTDFIAYCEEDGNSDNFKLIRTTNSGTTWTEIVIDPALVLTDVTAIPGSPGQYIALVYDIEALNGIRTIRTTDAGTTWTQLDEGIAYTALTFLNAQVGYAGTLVSDYSYGMYKWNTEAPEFTQLPTTEEATVDENDDISINIAAADPNYKKLTIQMVSGPSWLQLTDNGDGTGTFTGKGIVLYNQSTSVYPVKISVSNAAYTVEETIRISIKTSRTRPQFTSDPVTTAYNGARYRYEITVRDKDTDEKVKVDAIALPAWLELSDNGNKTATLTGVYNRPSDNPDNKVKIILRATDGHFETFQEYDLFLSETNDLTSVDATQIEVVPNPFKDYIRVLNAPECIYSITDLNGRLLKQGTLPEAAGQIDMQSIEAPVVLLQLHYNNQSTIIKVIKE